MLSATFIRIAKNVWGSPLGISSAETFTLGFLGGSRNREDGSADTELPGLRVRYYDSWPMEHKSSRRIVFI